MNEKVWITSSVSNECIRRARAFLAHSSGEITDRAMRDMYIRCVQDIIKSGEAVSINPLTRNGYERDYHFCMKSEAAHEGVAYIMKFTDASCVGWINKNTWHPAPAPAPPFTKS